MLHDTTDITLLVFILLCQASIKLLFLEFLLFCNFVFIYL